MPMKLKNLIYIAAFLFVAKVSIGQTFGVRAGLNYSTFLGPVEPSDDVDESFGYSNGFHFGLSYAYDFTDIFSVRSELLYIQNGTTQSHYGDAFYIIRWNGNTRIEKGDLEYDLNISNAYLSVPVMVNFRVSRKWEIFGGPYLNILIGPTGRGKLRFESYDRPDEITFRQSLDYNYNSDNVREITGSSPSAVDQIGIIIDGEEVALNRFAGAYTTQGERTGNKFNFLDAGITAGAHYFLNNGFFIGFQVDYGFLDLTNNDVDFSLKDVNLDNPDNPFIFSDDKDTHLGIHTSFGFRF